MRRTSRRSKRRTSRGVKANIRWEDLAVPAPRRGVPGQAKWPMAREAWFATTFAAGTPLKTTQSWDMELGSRPTYHGTTLRIPEGARLVSLGKIVKSDLFVEVTDARDSAGVQYANLIGQQGWIPAVVLEPLVDNWAQKQGRRTSRHALPRSQRSWMKPNPIPPAPQNDWDMLAKWTARTFPVGTPVKFVDEGVVTIGDWPIPAGAKGEVVDQNNPFPGEATEVEIQLYPPLPGDPRFATPVNRAAQGDKRWDWAKISRVWVSKQNLGAGEVVPLVDTWATATAPYMGRKLKGRVTPNNPEVWDTKTVLSVARLPRNAAEKKKMRDKIRVTFPPPTEAEMKKWNRDRGTDIMDVMAAYAKRTGVPKYAVTYILQIGWQNSKGQLRSNRRMRPNARRHAQFFATPRASQRRAWRWPWRWKDRGNDVFTQRVRGGELSIAPYSGYSDRWHLVFFADSGEQFEFDGSLPDDLFEAMELADAWADAGFPGARVHGRRTAWD